MSKVTESAIAQLEAEHPKGITSAAILAFLKEHGVKFGEATLRKWVQLGLLPRSVRVGQKGKHQGSKGQYPVRVVRRILFVRRLMAGNLTIEEIQRQFLFVRGDIEALHENLKSIFATLKHVMHDRPQELSHNRTSREIADVQQLADDLVERIEQLEKTLIDDPTNVLSEVLSQDEKIEKASVS